MHSPYERQPERRALQCLLQGSSLSSKASPCRFGCSGAPRLDLVSRLASCCLQKTVSANLPLREDGGKRRKMGNVEATIQLLKENCQVLLFEKNLLKKKITIPSSLCAQRGVCCFEIGL